MAQNPALPSFEPQSQTQPHTQPATRTRWQTLTDLAATDLVLYLTLTAVIVITMAVMFNRMSWLPYREDEAAHVHHAVFADGAREMVLLKINDLHPPGWSLMLEGWVALFGHTETMTRANGILLSAITLAIMYRLAADLTDRRGGLITVLVLAVTSAFHLYGTETRPYAALMLGVAGMSWAFLRWLRYRRFGYATLYVLFGVFALYTHFIAIYLLPVQFIVTLLLVRRPSVIVRTAVLFAFVALSFLGWVLVFLQTFFVENKTGVGYILEFNLLGIRRLGARMFFSPRSLAHVLLVVGLLASAPSSDRAAPYDNVFRFRGWRKGYIILPPLVFLAFAFVADIVVDALTPRTVMVILPLLGLWLGFAVWRLPRRVQLVVAAILLVALFNMPLLNRYERYTPIDEMVAVLDAERQPGEGVIVAAERWWWHMEPTYYFQERLADPVQNANMYHLVFPDESHWLDTYAGPPQNVTRTRERVELSYFNDFINARERERIWWVQLNESDILFPPFDAVLRANDYARVRRWRTTTARGDFFIDEYRRAPNDLGVTVVFDRRLALRNWSLTQSTDADGCPLLTLDTWWTARDTPQTNLVLVAGLYSGDGMLQRFDLPLSVVPPVEWEADRPYAGMSALTLCDLPPGEYDLRVAVRDGDVNLPAGLPDRDLETTVFSLTQVTLE